MNLQRMKFAFARGARFECRPMGDMPLWARNDEDLFAWLFLAEMLADEGL